MGKRGQLPPHAVILALVWVGSGHGSLISSKMWVGSEFVWVGSKKLSRIQLCITVGLSVIFLTGSQTVSDQSHLSSQTNK